MGALVALSYMVYGHHMFVSGMNPMSSLAFLVPHGLVITIPSPSSWLIWLGSLYGSKLRINSASLFSLGFVSMFISGGVSGFFLAQPSIDIMLHAYFVVGHFHLVYGSRGHVRHLRRNLLLVPQDDRRMMNEDLGKVHFWMTSWGRTAIFMPFHYLGSPATCALPGFTDDYLIPLIRCISSSPSQHYFTGLAQLIFLYNLIHSRFKGAIRRTIIPGKAHRSSGARPRLRLQ